MQPPTFNMLFFTSKVTDTKSITSVLQQGSWLCALVMIGFLLRK